MTTKNWTRGTLVQIKTQTGTGKTTFIMQTYIPWLVDNGHSVLLLVPRNILEKQLNFEFQKMLSNNVEKYKKFLSLVTIWTYQTLQEKLKYGHEIPSFFATICDEAHYFLHDSTFNEYTTLVYSYLVKQNERRSLALILLSATMETLEPVLKVDLPRKKGVISSNNDLLHVSFIIPQEYLATFSATATYENIDVHYLENDGNKELETLLPSLSGKTIFFVSNKKKEIKFTNF